MDAMSDPKSSGRTVYAPNRWAISAAPDSLFVENNGVGMGM